MSSFEESAGAIFDATLERTGEERAVFVAQACAGDAALRERVEALLRSHAEAGIFMSRSAAPARPAEEDQSGETIGRYKLLRRLGAGGCGVVYLAEQLAPVRRQAALKIIKLGMDTRSVIARFEVERQALALMDHPNMAKVFDAGETEKGRPYFVMELVEGAPITDFCDTHRLDIEQRLRLFVKVCEAVQHAHQKGIIHRDLKPSNIVVVQREGTTEPKVIDFGIAKATGGQQLTDKTIFTAADLFLGTPAYMSPEQAKVSSQDIDMRSDIYSLGVLLYELLTGMTPFDAGALLRAGLDEMRRMVREVDPPAPSKRLIALPVVEATATARTRQSEPTKLIQAVRGDLDWIVMKCLEKDPARRYATANDLAADIVRHLNNEPVVARPAGQIHRFQKLVRRNKAVASAVVVTVLSLIAGLVVSTRSWLEERAALRVAVAAQQEQSRLRQEAEKAALKSQATAQFLQDVLAGAEPRIASGRDSSLLLELVDNAAQRASDELTNQPDVESDVKMTIGFVYQGLQQNYKAEAVFRSVLDLRTKVFGSNSVQAAAAMVPLGFLCDWASDGMSMHTPAEAERWGRRALEIQEKHGATDPQLLASTCELLADTLSREGVSHFPEAEQLARRAVALNENVLTNKASFTANDPAYSLDVLARVFFHEKKYSDAEAAFRRVAGIYQQKGDKVETCWADYFLLQVLEDETKYSEAEPVGAGLLQMWEKLEGVESLPFAESAARLGECFYNDGKLAEAVAAERQALASAEKIRSKVNVDALCEESESILGCALKQQGKLAEAEAIERQALALARKINDPAGDTLQWPLINLGGVLNAERHFPEAEVLIREALSNTRKRTDSPIVGPEIKWGDTELGIALEGQGKLAEAEQMFRNAYSVTQRMWPNEPARWQLDSNILNGFLTSHPKAR